MREADDPSLTSELRVLGMLERMLWPHMTRVLQELLVRRGDNSVADSTCVRTAAVGMGQCF